MTWRGSLRDETAPDRARWDFCFLDEALRPTISPSDVDYELERHGSHLQFEIKRPGEALRRGALERMVSFSTKDRCFALVLWGERDEPTEAQWIIRGVVSRRRATDKHQVAHWVSRWKAWAERNGKRTAIVWAAA